MPDYAPDLRAALATQWRRLWNLEVVEQAETVVRRAWNEMLSDSLAHALRQVQAASRQLDLARDFGGQATSDKATSDKATSDKATSDKAAIDRVATEQAVTAQAAIARARDAMATSQRLADLVLSRYAKEHQAELDAEQDYQQAREQQRMLIVIAQQALDHYTADW